MPVNVAAALKEALAAKIMAAIDDALHEVFSLEAPSARRAAPVKRGPGRPPGPVTKRVRQQKEVTRWSPNKQARRVPIFVQEATGLTLKADVAAKYGEDAVFVKGKPAPKPLAGSGASAPASKVKAKPFARKATKKAA